jgi:virginiamycin B lyase
MPDAIDCVGERARMKCSEAEVDAGMTVRSAVVKKVLAAVPSMMLLAPAWGLSACAEPVEDSEAVEASLQEGGESSADTVSGSSQALFGLRCDADFEEFQPPTANGAPGTILQGPDGAMWFTENEGNKIGRITLAGSITEFAVPIANGNPVSLTNAPDGALWFSHTGGKIGRMTTAGEFTHVFDVPAAALNVPPFSLGLYSYFYPTSLIVGPDNALWFVTNGPNKIVRMTFSGQFTVYTVPTYNASPHFLANGSDGNLWFTEFNGNKIGRLTTAGKFAEYAIPTALAIPGVLTAGSDGALWFAEGLGNKIGRVSVDGVMKEFALPGLLSAPATIVSGPDNALWFVENVGNKVGRITTAGKINEVRIPALNPQPQGLAFASDGSLWFTEKSGGKIGVLRNALDLF